MVDRLVHLEKPIDRFDDPVDSVTSKAFSKEIDYRNSSCETSGQPCFRMLRPPIPGFPFSSVAITSLGSIWRNHVPH